MDRRSLRDLLDLEGVGRSAYRLDGTDAEDALSLGPTPDGWCVWFTERGERVNARYFSTEADACHCMAGLMLTDDSNRWVLVAGPADADVADQQLREWLDSVGISRHELRASDLKTEDLPWTRSEMRRRHWVLRTSTRRLPAVHLSEALAQQLDRIPEFRMGVHRVNVRLEDGRIIPDVIVAGRRVSWVAGENTIPFHITQVAELIDPYS